MDPSTSNELLTSLLGSSVSVAVIQKIKKSEHPLLRWVSERGTPKAAAVVSAIMSSASVIGIKWTFIEGVLTVHGLTPEHIADLSLRIASQYALQHWLYKLHKVSAKKRV